MADMEVKSSEGLLSELIESTHEVTSLAQSAKFEVQVFNEFSLLVDKLVPIFNDLKGNMKFMDHPSIQKAVESIGKELRRAKAMILSPCSKTLVKQIEDTVHDLGRSLGLVLFASLEVSADFKGKIGALHKDLMNARFDRSSASSPSHHSEFISEIEVEEEIKSERIGLDIDNVVVQLKHGNDAELNFALLGLKELIGGNKVDNNWIGDEGVIPVLFNRLSSSKPENRLIIIHLLTSLALDNAENKVNKYVWLVCVLFKFFFSP